MSGGGCPTLGPKYRGNSTTTIVLTSCGITVGNTRQMNMRKIEHEAARIVSCATVLVSIETLLKEVGWDTLSCRRKNPEQIQFYKRVNGLCPDYLSSRAPLLLEIIQHRASVMHLITNTYAQILSCITISFFLQ